MNSNLFDSIGLGNLDISYLFIGLTVLVVALIVLVIVQIVQLSNYKKKYNRFMQGKEAKSLESDIIGLYEDNKIIKVTEEKNKKDIRDLYRRLEYAFQKIGIVKYDAFKQMGGQLSFSLALLDENDNGFIINSVHSSDGCYSYTKEIKQGHSDLTLGIEEQKALDMAMGFED